MHLTHRSANLSDLREIIAMLAQDALGKTREKFSDNIDERYIEAFHKIDEDLNQYLMIAEGDDEIVGTCHLTIMPSLTFTGSTRMQIEAVRVHPDYRGQKIGEWMMIQAIAYGTSRGATIIQLTTNKNRKDALRFYERLGFEATHEGMKLYIGMDTTLTTK